MGSNSVVVALPNLSITLCFIGAALILVALNAFFVASEFAIVKVRRTRLQELAGQGVAAARISILCVDQLDEYLSATQLGITLVSLALGWIGESAFFNLFLIMFPESISQGTGPTHFAAAFLAFFIITLLHVVLGELVPKSMAIQKAERVTLWISRPLSIFFRVAKPLIRTFTWLANLVLHRWGYPGLEEAPLSEEELKIVMKESREDGVISESEAQIISRAFEFSDKVASNIMISSENVEFISLARGFEENFATTRRCMHTRFPLAKEGIDTVIGVVHMKDALQSLIESQSNDAFLKSARPAVFIDPTTKQDQILKLFKERRTHLAIIQDPTTQKNLGIVTLEDVLEHLVGDIQDEHGN